LDEETEFEAVSEAAGFLSRETGAEVVVRREDGAKHEKAAAAAPGKPALILE